MTNRERIRQMLLQCKDKKGEITATAVVAHASKNKKSALGRKFEWNNTRAAHAHRIATARELMTTYITVAYTSYSRVINVPEYVRSPRAEPQQQGMMSLDDMNRHDAQRTMEIEFKRVADALERARDVVGYLNRKHPGLVNALEQMVASLAKITDMLKAAE
jgi:hypothetical protein